MKSGNIGVPTSTYKDVLDLGINGFKILNQDSFKQEIVDVDSNQTPQEEFTPSLQEPMPQSQPNDKQQNLS